MMAVHIPESREIVIIDVDGDHADVVANVDDPNEALESAGYQLMTNWVTWPAPTSDPIVPPMRLAIVLD